VFLLTGMLMLGSLLQARIVTNQFVFCRKAAQADDQEDYDTEHQGREKVLMIIQNKH
jgi:hypothetical protein